MLVSSLHEKEEHAVFLLKRSHRLTYNFGKIDPQNILQENNILYIRKNQDFFHYFLFGVIICFVQASACLFYHFSSVLII